MSNRPWICALCGWSGATVDASYTDAGAKRCPTCRSGALVLADPDAEARNAAGAAKRITGEREKKLQREAPLLAYAGIEKVEPVTAEEVLARRDEEERRSAVWWKEQLRHRAAQEEQALAIRAQLAPLLGPEVLQAMDDRRAALPADYGLHFWSTIHRKYESGELAAEREQERRDDEEARELRAELAALVSAERMADLDAGAARFHATAGSGARVWWRARLGQHLGVPSGPPLDAMRAHRRGLAVHKSVEVHEGCAGMGFTTATERTEQ